MATQAWKDKRIDSAKKQLAAYDKAIEKLHKALTLAESQKEATIDRLEWLESMPVDDASAEEEGGTSE
jgi:hypothetical protein